MTMMRTLTLAMIAVAAALVVDGRMQKLQLLEKLEAVAAQQQSLHNAASQRRFGAQAEAVGIEQQPTQTGGAHSTAPPHSTTGAPGGGAPVNDKLPSDAAPQCQFGTPFAAAFDYVDDVCTRAFGKLDRVNTTNETATREGYDTFCKGSCLSAMNQLLADEEFRDCLPYEVAKIIEPMLGFCQKDAKGEYCVLKFAQIAERPPEPADTCTNYKSQSTCQAVTNCTWDVHEKSCERSLTAAALDKICDPCIITLAESSSSLAALALSCHQVDGHYCAIELQKFNIDNPSPASLTQMCSNDYTLLCVTQMLSLASQTNVANAQLVFIQCANAASTADGVKTCVSTYLSGVASYQRLIAQVPDACRKNAAGRFCYEAAMQGTLENSCFVGVIAGSTSCSTGSCATEVQNISTTLGCCLGFYDELFTPAPFSEESVPGNWPNGVKAYMPAPAPLVPLSVAVNLSLVSTCANYAAPVPLTDRCFGTTAVVPTEVLYMNLKVNWTHVKAEGDWLKREMARVLSEDVAATVGAHPDVIINASVVVNASLILNKRNDTGMTFMFRIKASSQRLTDAFKSQFVQANDEGDFSLLVLGSLIKAVCEHTCLGPQGLARAVVARAPSALTLGNEVLEDPCYNREFFGTVAKVLSTCAALDDPFSVPFVSKAASNASFTALCAGECVTGLRGLASGKYAQCLPQYLQLQSNFIAVSCTTDSQTKFLCGTVIHEFESVDCSDKNQTTCTGQCSWNTKKSRCDTRPTTAFLAGICEGECVPRLTASLAGDSGSIGTEARFIDQAICAQDFGAYCIPAIADELNDEEFSLATVESLCSNGTKGRCFRKFQTALSGQVIKLAEETFFTCADNVQYDEIKVVEQCLTDYFVALVSAEKFDDLIKDMCLTKTGTNVLCLSYFDKYADHGCVEAAQEGTCNSTCVTQLGAAFEDMGCCAGTLQAIFGIPEKDAALVPDFSGDDTPGGDVALPGQATTAAPPPAIPSGFVNSSFEEEVPLTEGFLTKAYKCTGDATYKFVRRACKKDREGGSVPKGLPIGIAFEAIKNDKKRRDRLVEAARADLANKLGVAKDDITSIEFVEDKLTKITITKTSGRGLAAQATANTTQSSGSTLNFTVHAQKQTDTQAASKAFDNAVAANKLTLPATTGTVSKECKNCVAAGASASSVQAAAPVTTLQTQSTTTAKPSSASVPAVLGSVLALALALLL